MPARQPAIPGFGPDDPLPVPSAEPVPTPATAPPLPGGFAARVGLRPTTPSLYASRVAPRPSLFDLPPHEPAPDPRPHSPPHSSPVVAPLSATRTETAAGAVGKARDLLAAVRTLKAVERAGRPATAAEREALARFPGFGAVALAIFPNLATGCYPDAGWQARGEELAALLTPDEYASAKRTTFSQYFTAPTVMAALHAALARLGVPAGATVLEPGCGTGNFLTEAHRYIGVELDSVTGRIAKLLHPAADIRVENFRDTRLPPLDGVIGNVPFADLKLDWRGERLALHDFFLAKAVDALKPGGVLACVTSRFTLDKQNAAARERLAAQADFLGAIRLPSDAFRREGTEVVTDLVFLRKRGPGQPPAHADGCWLETAPLEVEGATVAINRYFLAHPDMVLGKWSRKDTLYGGEGVSVIGTGDLAEQLAAAVSRLPRFEPLTVDAQRPQPPPAPAFVPPPPLRHVAEGSLFTGDDRAIYQIEDGRPAPVTYCGVLLRADGTPQGRKIGQLIDLRDRARRVLQSQNEGWPVDARAAERQSLNRAYDRFVAQHGPINKTTLTDTKFGTIRRMPNLVRFRDDPDAMLVMSLEEYDEATGAAAKAAILRQDVVGPKPPVTRVATAEDGLLVSLDRTGGIDLPLIARLYGRAESEVIAELGDLVYRDPATGRWETSDAYLAGNVRDKLVRARAAGPEFARNAAALEQVQPEDVLPGDIDANLGAPWIPASDIRAFAADLFAVPPEAIKVDHLKPDAVWCLEADHRAQNSVSATADYGTGRVNGTTLLELALNLKSPAIYDVIRSAEGEQRVLNPSETLAAKEKQRRIKDQFKAWVFSDPDRTERLVRTYNDAFNSLRPRLFDGSHLDFPCMSQAFELRPHQRDAVWRCMSGGNTLLAHVVGAGKTAVMVTAAMKMRQAGLCHKPLVVVPNHMLEQITREWLHLYPNARILTATKDDFTKDKRKHLTAKIATGDWDGVVVTQSGFERMGMSREYQERFLREQIAEYEALLAGNAGGGRNLLKTIEKQKVRREERLKSLLAEDKKDDGLVFDELGVDQLFVDESHYAKNLETPTKMERVAGVQTGGSERAFDLYMKCRYLDEKHPGRGVVFASGTPVSNSMVELYTVQKFLDPAGLQSRGIAHFDGWAATFGEVVEAMEISPDGATLKPRSRFAKFVNLPELVQLFRSFADVQTADMLDLPRPKLEGGKAQTVACAMSEVAEGDAGQAGGAVRAHPQRAGGPAGGQRAGHHHRRPQAGPGRPAVRGRGRLPRLEGERAGPQRPPHLGGDGRHPRHAAGVLRPGRPRPAALRLRRRGGQAGVGRHPGEPGGRHGGRRHRRQEAGPVRAGPPGRGAGADRLDGQDGHRHQRAAAAGRPASSRRPVEAGRGRAAGGPHPPPGEHERRGVDLPLRHGRELRRLHVAGAGDQGPVHRPGDGRRLRGAKGRGRGGTGVELRRGEGHRQRQPGRADAGRNRRRAATPRHPAEEPPRRAVPCPPEPTGTAGQDRRPHPPHRLIA